MGLPILKRQHLFKYIVLCSLFPSSSAFTLLHTPLVKTWGVWCGTHYTKVTTTYALQFRPPFFRSLENLYSFDPYIIAKIKKMSYFDPYFSLKKMGKLYSFDPPFSTLVAFWVDGRCWASLSETWPSTPPPGIPTPSSILIFHPS